MCTVGCVSHGIQHPQVPVLSSVSAQTESKSAATEWHKSFSLNECWRFSARWATATIEFERSPRWCYSFKSITHLSFWSLAEAVTLSIINIKRAAWMFFKLSSFVLHVGKKVIHVCKQIMTELANVVIFWYSVKSYIYTQIGADCKHNTVTQMTKNIFIYS